MNRTLWIGAFIAYGKSILLAEKKWPFFNRFSLLFTACFSITVVTLAQTPRMLPSTYIDNGRINYIRTWDALAPDTSAVSLRTRPVKDVKQTTVYFDGLGRPLQTVVKKGSLVTDPANLVSAAGAVDLMT